MTSLVVDASVAVKWLVYEQRLSDEAEAVARSRYRLIAPRILLTEVANALVRRANRGELDIDDANAHRYRHPIYDLIYVELASRHKTRVVTADQRLAARLVGTPLAQHIVLLSDWRAA